MPRQVERAPAIALKTTLVPVTEVATGDVISSFPGMKVTLSAPASYDATHEDPNVWLIEGEAIGNGDMDDHEGFQLFMDREENIQIMREVEVPPGICKVCLKRDVKYNGLQMCGTCYAREHRSGARPS